MSPRAKVKAGGIVRTSIDSTWRTPEFVLEHARKYFGGPIPFDPATGRENPTQALRFCAGPEGTLFAGESLESKNGLEVEWIEHGPTWVNPPFSKAWTVKISEESAQGAEIVALLPCNRFEEPWFQAMFAQAPVVCWVNATPFQQDIKGNKKRIAFISTKDGKALDRNPFASMIVGFHVEVDKFREAFGPLGLVHDLGVP